MSRRKKKYNIVFVHGFLGAAGDWRQIAEKISQQQTGKVFTPTLPGHGRFPEELPAQSSDGMLGWLVNYLNNLCKNIPGNDEPRLLLVGYSLGGRLLLSLAAQLSAGVSLLEKPSAIAGMVIESANPGIAEQQKRSRWQLDLQWSRLFAQQPLKKTLAAWYQQDIFGDLTDDERARLIVQRSACDPGSIAGVLLSCSLARQPDYRAVMLNPPCPLYYWYGGKDKKFQRIANELRSLQSSQVVGNEMGSIRLKRVLEITQFANAGHNCHFSDPGEYVRQLLAVLSEPSF